MLKTHKQANQTSSRLKEKYYITTTIATVNKFDPKLISFTQVKTINVKFVDTEIIHHYIYPTTK